MNIAIMSDTHDNIPNLRKAVEIIVSSERRIETIIHCGDFVAPFMLKELQNAKIPVHGVFGNNDGDKHLLTKMSLAPGSSVTLHGMAGVFDADGFKIGFAHERLIADGLVHNDGCDLVCFGHSHEYVAEKKGDTVIVNPGEIMGKNGDPGFVVFDTAKGTHERIGI